MGEPTKKVTVLALKRLLVELMEHRPDIYIRYRLIGQMWSKNFLRIVRMTDQGALLHDEITRKFIKIPDLSLVMQFEIDKTFQLYQPHFHYDIIAAGEW